MSNPKHDWWNNAVWAVRNYKRRCDELAALPVMPRMKQMEYDAVTMAIQLTNILPDGKSRLSLIDRMYWQGRKLAIEQVVFQVGVAEATGRRWHADFIRLVGKCLGYFA